MYIRTDETNKIELVSLFDRPETVEFKGELPEDFFETFSLGKYLFADGEIVKNTSYGEASLPQDIPHRTILIAEGISSIQELPEDLTIISGIGSAKADDINNYLTNQ